MTRKKKEPDLVAADEVAKTTLFDFIEINHKIISSLGVFTALTIFSMSLQLAYIGNLLTILFLMLTILLWFEIVWRLPWGDSSITLSCFKYGIRLVFPLLLLYHLVEFRYFWKSYLIIPIWASLLAVFSGLLKKYGFFTWVHTESTTWKHNLKILLGAVIFFIFLWPATKLSVYLAFKINAELDKTYTYYLEKNIEEMK